MVRKRKLPARINHSDTARLLAIAEEYSIEWPEGYQVFCVEQRRGRCRYSAKYITVPRWAMNEGRENYAVYYLAHEVAHAWTFEDSGERNHGGDFHEWFKVLCPEDAQHYELEYKPKFAAAAGISKKV